MLIKCLGKCLFFVVDFYFLELWCIMYLLEIFWWVDLNLYLLFLSFVVSWLRIRNFVCVICYLYFIFNWFFLILWIIYFLYFLECVFFFFYWMYFDFMCSFIVCWFKNFICLLLILIGGMWFVLIESLICISLLE